MIVRALGERPYLCARCSCLWAQHCCFLVVYARHTATCGSKTLTHGSNTAIYGNSAAAYGEYAAICGPDADDDGGRGLDGACAQHLLRPLAGHRGQSIPLIGS
eukprot:2363375-Rhodomonas_salina.4